MHFVYIAKFYFHLTKNKAVSTKGQYLSLNQAAVSFTKEKIWLPETKS